MMRDSKMGDDMTRVLLVGLLAETVDDSDPALPPCMNAKKIQAGIELGSRMAGRRMPDPTRCNGRSYCSAEAGHRDIRLHSHWRRGSAPTQEPSVVRDCGQCGEEGRA